MTWQSFKQAWLIRFWSPVPAVIAAGILSTYYFGITGTFWAVTGEFTRWGGQLLQLLGVHSEQWGYYQLIHLEGTPLTRIDGRMIIGMFGGCLAAALWANNVKLRFPRSRIRIVQAVAGGIIAFFVQWGIYGLIVNAMAKSGILSIISTVPFASMSHLVLLVFLGAGFAIGAGGSAMAIQKFLKV